VAERSRASVAVRARHGTLIFLPALSIRRELSQPMDLCLSRQ
jgi:hypothetical protein